MGAPVSLLMVFGIVEIGHHGFFSDFLQHYKEECTETLILVDVVIKENEVSHAYQKSSVNQLAVFVIVTFFAPSWQTIVQFC